MSMNRVLRQSRRYFSSNGVGTIKRRPVKVKEYSEFAASEEAPVEVPVETTMANVALASGLFAFCLGVGWYSMNAVGQAGSDSDDPLALLKQEAAEAQESRNKEARNTTDATEMLKQFQSGGYDPDKYDELEEDAPKKKPWWKFW